MSRPDSGNLLHLPEPSPPAEAPRPPGKGRRLLRRSMRLLIPVLIATGVSYAGWRLAQSPPAEPGYRTEQVKIHTVIQQVTAAGQIEPALTAEVHGAISGQIDRVLVDFGSTVSAGQILAHVEPTTYELLLKEARINLTNAQAALDLARRRAAQSKTLSAEGLMPMIEYDKAANESRLAEGSAKIAEAAVARAQVDLDRCSIRAPIGGVVISRNVTPGQGLGAEAPLFVIAGDMRKMIVAASVAEADVGGVRPGLKATFTVDAFPERTFRGTLTQVRSLATIEQNVVSYPAIIEVDNPNLDLRPGMTANVSIVVAKRDHALTIPNKALRFRPPDDRRADRDHPDSGGGAMKASEAGWLTVYHLAEGSGAVEGSVGPESVRIRTGISDGHRTEILEGLREGEQVIVGLESGDGEKKGLLARIPELFAGDSPRHRRK